MLHDLESISKYSSLCSGLSVLFLADSYFLVLLVRVLFFARSAEAKLNGRTESAFRGSRKDRGGPIKETEETATMSNKDLHMQQEQEIAGMEIQPRCFSRSPPLLFTFPPAQPKMRV